MATTDVRTMWQRTASNRFQESDTIRAPKLAHCPNLPKTHPETFHYEMVRGVDQQAPSSYYWSNSWSSLDTKTAWQMSPSTLCDQRSDCLALDEFLGSRCLSKPAGLQALAAERTSNAKLSSGMMGITSEYATGAELELEWQLIVDPKPKSGLSASFRAAEAKKRNEELKNTNAVHVEGNDATPVELAISSMKKNRHESLMSKTFRESEEVCQQGSMISEGEQAESLMTSGKHHQYEESSMGKYQETSRGKCTSYGSQSFSSTMTSSSVSWRTANKEALVALVAQKAKERLENCDLPTPLSRSIVKHGPLLESCDCLMADCAMPESMESFDRSVMNSILQAGEPTPSETLGIPASSPNALETSYNLTGQFARMSLPLTIPTKSGQAASSAMHCGYQNSSFAENRQASWKGEEKAMSCSSLGKSSGPLGEALCHSQTRAREAEKRAEESFQDYQKVAHLFFREASLSLTYRQWVESLQAENARLKMYVHRYQQATTVWLQPSGCSPFSVLERFTNCRWSTYGKDHHARRQMQHGHFSSLWPADQRDDITASFVISGEGGAEIIMGCTLSFAFALGLSLAGAGLMLGWSMGWILLAK